MLRRRGFYSDIVYSPHVIAILFQKMLNLSGNRLSADDSGFYSLVAGKLGQELFGNSPSEHEPLTANIDSVSGDAA